MLLSSCIGRFHKKLNATRSWQLISPMSWNYSFHKLHPSPVAEQRKRWFTRLGLKRQRIGVIILYTSWILVNSRFPVGKRVQWIQKRVTLAEDSVAISSHVRKHYQQIFRLLMMLDRVVTLPKDCTAKEAGTYWKKMELPTFQQLVSAMFGLFSSKHWSEWNEWKINRAVIRRLYANKIECSLIPQVYFDIIPLQLCSFHWQKYYNIMQDQYS